MHPHQRWLDQN